MWVVKFGGSLLKTVEFQDVLKKLADHGAGKMILVPGGGVFADQVRYLQEELQIDDVTAHRMALRAMEQLGALIISMDPRFHAANSVSAINDWLEKNEIPVWFPYDMVADNPAIRASWDITSDSLSLWLANLMKCQNLVLLKPILPDKDDYSADYLSQLGFLDTGFAEMMQEMLVKPWWLFYEQVESFFNLLDCTDGSASGMKEIVKK